MPVKVILWITPRSASTAFERAIQQSNNVKIFHEPYSKAYLLGPDKKCRSALAYNVDKNIDLDLFLSYKDVKSLITTDYNGKDIFVKDSPFAIACFDDFLNQELLCFTHTFLIRSPEKTVKSFYKAWKEVSPPHECEFDQTFMVMCYEKQLELHNFIAVKLTQQALIIDADDLLNNPQEILREYCKKTGLTYHENMLNWKEPAGDEIERVPWRVFHKVALESASFHLPKQTDYSFIPGDIMRQLEECIVKCQYSYKTLFEKRLKI